jgi:hypothetical protein
MDPLVERRELVRNVHLHAKDLKRNIEASLLAQLRHQHEGRCVSEGYLMKRSLTVVEHSLGRMNLIRGGLDYVVKFQADVCLPHPGQHFRVPVVLTPIPAPGSVALVVSGATIAATRRRRK